VYLSSIRAHLMMARWAETCCLVDTENNKMLCSTEYAVILVIQNTSGMNRL